MVYDGHDFLSHHRRLDPLDRRAREFGLKANFMRYALDLYPVDSAGMPYRGTGGENTDWYGFGLPLLAPGDGRVVAAQGDRPDDDIRTRTTAFTAEQVAANALNLYGNYVVIDHGRGEFSLLGHLKRGSLTVRAGDRVRAGQPIAQMGMSGSAEFTPHLHYELRTGPGGSADGLPAYFRDFRRYRGSRATLVREGALDTGDVVESISRTVKTSGR